MTPSQAAEGVVSEERSALEWAARRADQAANGALMSDNYNGEYQYKRMAVVLRRLSTQNTEGWRTIESAPKSQAEQMRDPIYVLKFIANAKRFDEFHFKNDTEFADWAQSLARHIVNAPTLASRDVP